MASLGLQTLTSIAHTQKTELLNLLTTMQAELRQIVLRLGRKEAGNDCYYCFMRLKQTFIHLNITVQQLTYSGICLRMYLRLAFNRGSTCAKSLISLYLFLH